MPVGGDSYSSRTGQHSESAGRRGLCDEKPFVTELSRLFHVVKAQHAERHNQRRNASADATTTATTTATQPPPPRARGNKAQSRPVKSSRRASARVSRRGGSVWVMLKAGFAAVPLASQKRAIAHKAAVRARLSVRARVAALQRAEAYVQSAWQQAREAGLVTNVAATTTDSAATAAATTAATAATVSEEGARYLQEQYAVAAAMLQPAPVGTRLRHLVHTHSSSSSNRTSVANATRDVVDDDDDDAMCRHAIPGRRQQQLQQQQGQSNRPLMTTAAWHDVWRREYVIRHAVYTPDAHAQAEAALRAAIAANDDAVVTPDAPYYFAVAEPCTSSTPPQPQQQPSSQAATTTHDAAHGGGGNDDDDVVASRCIVRIRNSQRMKRTTIVHKPKDVNHFVSNFMQVLRRELASSKLPRGPVESLGDGGSAATTTTPQQPADAATLPQQQQQQKGSARGGRGGGGGGNTRRRR